MKINETMKEWMSICVIAACVLAFLFGMYSYMDNQSEERKRFAKEKPVEYAQERCYSKVRGSRPACWSDADWKVFCSKVQCIQQ